MQYKPKTAFNVPFYILQPTTTKVNGVVKKTYPTPTASDLCYGSFKSYGGTEITVNGLLVVEDTAEVETWYKPEIKANCLLVLANSNASYEIISEPENINLSNQFVKFKVRRTKGGA
ncbi:MAG: head-tail adaptor protein [Clostridia bacterium]|nr:head-tail adaptor protein [Clostridia bacterium]